MALELRVDEVFAKVARAASDAIDETTREAAEIAARAHPWVSRTRNLEEHIINRAAHREGDGHISGRFGTTYAGGAPGVRDAFYGLFLEVGTSRMAARPFLRPAADAAFPNLADRIRRNFHGGHA